MTTGSHIRAVGDADRPERALDDSGVDSSAQTLDAAPEDWIDDDHPDPFPHRRGWRTAAIALIAVAMLAWTGFFVWAILPQARQGAAPAQWIEWTGAWSLPIILLLALWLLALRSSTREAARFTDVAAHLSAESERLESRLLVINRELSLAREFLEGETRALDSLGRSAGDRLSGHAARLQELVAENGARLEGIETVSLRARENMEKLRENLPVIAGSAKDVANQVGNAGRMANERLGELHDSFARLDDVGSASERRVAGIRAELDGAAEEFATRLDTIGETAANRFDALRADSATLREELDAHDIQAAGDLERRIAALRDQATSTSGTIREGEEAALALWSGQIDALHERLATMLAEMSRIDERALNASNEKLAALSAEARAVDDDLARRDAEFERRLASRRAALDDAQDAAIARMSDNLASFDKDFFARRDAQQEHLQSVADASEATGQEVERLARAVAEIAERAQAARGDIGRSADHLTDTIATSEESLRGVEGAVAGLTDASVRLLELIRASARHGADDLPVAIADFEERLTSSEARVEGLRLALEQAGETGAALDKAAGDAEASSLRTGETIGAITSQLEGASHAQDALISELRDRLTALEEGHRAAADAIRDSWQSALGELEERSQGLLGAIDGGQAERIRTLAEEIGTRGGEAVDASLREALAEAIAGVEETARRASTASREATVHLRDQLARVDELARNLESRVAHARRQAEEQADNDFSRRVALITDSLNSSAIDISKALSTEVTDTAWAAYLRGDRGIFTRRAVRLLDTAELREIADLYAADGDFREHVSRYIHDFEAMLRTLLSTRDGNALGVTVLSSDMGKLYVTLAQAIERLRD